MEIVLVMAAVSILMMVLAFLSLTRDDRELAQEELSHPVERQRAA